MIGAICRSMAAALLVAAAALVAVPALAAEAKAVETDGLGVLTICRSWMLFTSCNSYNHIAIPARLAVGDTIDLIFGSNTKKIRYPIAAIAQSGNSCTIYNAVPHGAKRVDNIVTPCRPATP
jgi:hypothetical protein